MSFYIKPQRKEQWKMVVEEEDHASHSQRDNMTEWTGQSLSLLHPNVDDKSMGRRHSRGVCRMDYSDNALALANVNEQ